MKITGTKNSIEFDFENGYIAKAEGELLTGRRFVVYTNTLESWEAPHSDEPFSDKDIRKIIDEVNAKTNSNTMQLIFE